MKGQVFGHMANPLEYPVVLFESRAAWAQWLSAHHSTERGIWLRLAKGAASFVSVSRGEALDVALCYGWIDGQARRMDGESWLQKFTPRRRRSVWSKRNREHVERLIRSGEMQAPGLAEVEAARADGRWDRAYDSPATADVPDDLKAALDRRPEAKSFFDALTARNRYAILYRIQTAVRPETRARRVAEFVEMLARKETLYP